MLKACSVLLILICLLLQSCVSPKMSQETQLGKILFIDGEYKSAFRRLLPAAVCGNPEAQYAVGYMYYYGYGVSQDSESGIFWMTKSAEQGYRPAIKALAIIRRGPICEGPCRNGCTTVPIRRIYKEEDSVMRSLDNHAYQPQPVHLKKTYSTYLKQAGYTLNDHPVAPVVPAKNEVKKVEAKNSQDHPVLVRQPEATVATKKPSFTSLAAQSKQYALQLFGSYELKDAKNIQDELELQNNAHIYHTKNKDKDWYVLTYGQYASAALAKQAKGKLPEAVADLEPWIRKLDGLDEVG
ncbi:MAG: SPOR domain-containing protein [Gammaproteobacteria bacterium]